MNTLIDLNSLHNMRTEWGVEHADTDDLTGALYGAVRSCVSWSDTNQWDVFLSRMQHARPDLFYGHSSDDIAQMKRTMSERAALFFNPHPDNAVPYILSTASDDECERFAPAVRRVIRCFLGAVHNAFVRNATHNSGYLASDETGWDDVMARHMLLNRFRTPCLVVGGRLRCAHLDRCGLPLHTFLASLREVSPGLYRDGITEVLNRSNDFYFVSSENYYAAGSSHDKPVVFSTADKANHLSPLPFAATQALLAEYGYTPENVTKTMQIFIDGIIAENNHD